LESTKSGTYPPTAVIAAVVFFIFSLSLLSKRLKFDPKAVKISHFI